jgi:hypothetical protein
VQARQFALPVLFLDYAENLRRKLQAGDLRSTTQLEGPHNTAEVLSASKVYHVRGQIAILIAHVYWASFLLFVLSKVTQLLGIYC